MPAEVLSSFMARDVTVVEVYADGVGFPLPPIGFRKEETQAVDYWEQMRRVYPNAKMIVHPTYDVDIILARHSL